MSSDDTKQILALLKAAYPRQPISAETLTAYAMLLDDLPVEELKRAALDHIASSKWFPAISELRAAAMESSALPDFDGAWGEVQAQIRAGGANEAPQFSCPAIAEVVRAIGWRQICLSDAPGVERAAFRDMYQARRTRDEHAANVEPMLLAAGARGSLRLAGGK